MKSNRLYAIDPATGIVVFGSTKRECTQKVLEMRDSYAPQLGYVTGVHPGYEPMAVAPLHRIQS
jgi:hypothetical protein